MRWPCWTVVEFWRAVPVLLSMIFIGILLGLAEESNRYWAVVLALTLYNGAVLAEVFRAGINAVPKGQVEAAYAVGMRKNQVMLAIQLPQAVKIMLPALISQCVVALKDTALGYVVLAPGLTFVARFIYANPDFGQNQIPTVIVIGGIYVVLNLILTGIATWVQRNSSARRRCWRCRWSARATRARRPWLRVESRLALGRHPEPDLALDDDRAVVAHTFDPDGQVAVGGVPLHLVGLGDTGDVTGRLCGVGDLHALGDPALVLRDGHLGERAHRGLQPVAQRDGVHGADVVLDATALRDHQLHVVRLDDGEPRVDGGEVRRFG